MNWTKGSEPVDLYDSRMQPWYIVAASSPKDVMILIDNSGSMIGQKQKIARNAVNTILETLSPNDFVNVLSFGDKVKEVVSCFNTTLVQVCFLERKKKIIPIYYRPFEEYTIFTLYLGN